ncbi:glutamine amidotransferase [Ktedonosporobacter rubrisoli]|uniref:Lipid II isoglutaminyl synthase (glutamine-hydrolyzing) subunit GatD n=2 Tax=Ktedonosporobacter rubrisoli TaxID=2509675 RepID=A0A4P6K643_KTERU|nr:glutamine amidotransferase [Ktedonosporobacter rubrisoli]
MVLKIGFLYPTLMSVAADRGNLFAIEKRCKWRGIATEVEPIYVKQTPDFTQFDLILIHGAADREMEIASQDIQFKAESLREAAEANVAFLCVCAGYQLMGHYYRPFKGPELKGVSVLDLYTEASNERFMTHMALECDLGQVGKKVLVGYENHSGRTFLGAKAKPLGHVLVGWGNNGQDGGEGAYYKNVFGTYLHGPVLPKNPWFTDLLIQTALERRYGKVELVPLDDSIEEASHAAALKLAEEFKGTMSAIDATPWKK